MNRADQETEFEHFIKKTLLNKDQTLIKCEEPKQIVPAAINDLLASDEVTESAKAQVRQLLDELKEKERDLQLAAKIGQVLLENNTGLSNEIRYFKESSCQSPVPMSPLSSGFNSPLVSSSQDAGSKRIPSASLPKTPRKFSPAVGLFVDHEYITQLEEENARLLKQLTKIAHDTPQSSKSKNIIHVEKLELELRGLRQDYEDKCVECRDLIDKVRKLARTKSITDSPSQSNHQLDSIKHFPIESSENVAVQENHIAVATGVQTDPAQSLEISFSQIALINQTDIELENIKKQLTEYQLENQELKSQLQDVGSRDQYMLTPCKSQRMSLASELKKAALESQNPLVCSVGIECKIDELEKDATSMQVIVNNKTGELTMLYLLGDLILAVVKCPFVVVHKVFRSMLKPKNRNTTRLLQNKTQ